jgi:hypothetical protein
LANSKANRFKIIFLLLSKIFHPLILSKMLLLKSKSSRREEEGIIPTEEEEGEEVISQEGFPIEAVKAEEISHINLTQQTKIIKHLS